MIWHETSIVHPLASGKSMRYMRNLHPRIQVLRHPGTFPVRLRYSLLLVWFALLLLETSCVLLWSTSLLIRPIGVMEPPPEERSH